MISDALEEFFKLTFKLLILSAFFVPLGIWKFVELIIGWVK